MKKELVFNIISFTFGILTIIFTFVGYIRLENSLSVLVLIITAWAIARQAFATEQLAEAEFIPKANFLLMSGTSHAKHKNKNQNKTIKPQAKNKLDTQLIYLNKSKFFVDFEVIINLKVKQSDGSKRSREFNFNQMMSPENKMRGHDGSDMLSWALLESELNQIDWSTVDLGKKIDNIEKVEAIIKLTLRPSVKKDMSMEIRPRKWEFDLDSLKWIDPAGTRDDNIEIKDIYVN